MILYLRDISSPLALAKRTVKPISLQSSQLRETERAREKMLLRSSSTPVLGSLAASFSDSPNSSSVDHNRPPSDHLKRLSFAHSNHHPNFHPFSCNSSPTPHSIAPRTDFNQDPKGFRRASSDGNLQSLAAAAHDDDFHNWIPPKSSRRPSAVLETIPSFTVHRRTGIQYEEEEEEEDEEEEQELSLPRSVTIGENMTPMEGYLGFDADEGIELVGVDEESKGEAALFLAKGLGINSGDSFGFITDGGSAGGGGRSNFPLVDSGGAGGNDGSDVESYYKRMVEENPGNPLFLRNYAHYLYQSKGDPAKVEEYYMRAILAGPGDGEILSQYAKFIWEEHGDRQRASSYFEQATQSAPEDRWPGSLQNLRTLVFFGTLRKGKEKKTDQMDVREYVFSMAP
ncbi:hypothetical protein ACLOJK_011235 [Asimina triloba]